MQRFKEFLLNRPFAFILILASIRTFVYGALFAIGTPDAQMTIMWSYLTEYSINNVLFGSILVLVSVAAAVFLVKANVNITNRLMYFQALLWFVIGIIYLAQANYILAVVMGFTWFILIGFANFHYKKWVERKELENAKAIRPSLSQGQV